VGFIAAILFWNKGSAAVNATNLLRRLSIKLTGAGAIFVSIVVVFHFINPLDPKKIWIIYSNQPQLSYSPSETTGPHIIKQSQMQGLEFDFDKMVVELIPAKYIFDLSPRLEDRSFMTREAIPKGVYKIRFIMRDSGASKQYMINVP